MSIIPRARPIHRCRFLSMKGKCCRQPKEGGSEYKMIMICLLDSLPTLSKASNWKFEVPLYLRILSLYHDTSGPIQNHKNCTHATLSFFSSVLIAATTIL